MWTIVSIVTIIGGIFLVAYLVTKHPHDRY